MRPQLRAKKERMETMMKLNRTVALCAVGLLGAYACGTETGNGGTNSGNGTSGNGTSGNGSGGVIDAGMEPDPIVDAGDSMGDVDMGVATEDMGEVEVCEGPSSGFGTREGANFRPFDGVTYCDGTAFDFYTDEDGFCESTFTVLIRAAEWCGPCRLEAQEIGQGIMDEYGPLGVRFLTVIDQNQAGGAPTQSVCSNWENSFSLDREAIDHRMLMDPAQEVAVYFPPGQNGYPGNVIVNREGQIVRRIIGFTPNLSGLRATLDELLGR